jgi:hypothetical protein
LSSTTFVDAVELVLVGEQVAGLDRRRRVQVVELVNTDGHTSAELEPHCSRACKRRTLVV